MSKKEKFFVGAILQGTILAVGFIVYFYSFFKIIEILINE